VGVVLAAVLAVLSYLSVHQQGVWYESETLWLNQIAVYPTSPAGNHQLGRHYVGRTPARFDLAEPRFRAAFAHAPSYVDPQHSLGLLLRQTGRPAEAIEVFTNIVRGTPSHRDTWFQLGMLLWDAGRTKDAVSSFDNFVRLDRANYNGWRVLAKAQAAASRPKEAVESFEKGIAAAGRPERAAPLLADLAWTLATNPDPAVRDGRRALELASRALEAGPPNPQTVLSLGAACAEAGEFQRGVREVEAAIPKLPPEVEPAMRKLVDDLSKHQVVRAVPRFP
jgi:predicted Zn-dependent protease